jgi:ADP-ribose pyrophosphatase YjhB (NUDIX family)
MLDRRWVVTVSGVFTNDDGRVLLVRPAGRGWEPPGGRVDPDEGPLQAIVCEAREEFGCVMRWITLLA